MTRRGRRRNKQRIGPVKAMGLFLVCCAVAAWHLHPMSGLGKAMDSSGWDGLEDYAVVDEPDAVLVDEEDVHWVDLLAVYGSYDASTPVRVAFSSLLAAQTYAAPGGETAPLGRERWVGEDPPLRRLSVIMVSERSRRAVFGGSVVGVGDAVAGGRVLAIEPGCLLLSWRGRELTYDLDDVAPREFRSELQRRRDETETSDGDEDADANADAVEPVVSKEKE